MATVTLRYWAALRAAAGESEQQIEAVTLSDALQVALSAHAETPRFSSVLGICAIVVDETPVGSLDHSEVSLTDGAVIDLLPPFAGG